MENLAVSIIHSFSLIDKPARHPCPIDRALALLDQLFRRPPRSRASHAFPLNRTGLKPPDVSYHKILVTEGVRRQRLELSA